MSFYFASTSQHADTNYTFLERRMAEICGLSLRPSDIDSLNVQYYNSDILKILYQMYSVMHDTFFPNEIKSYMTTNLLNPCVFEPIFHIIDNKEEIVHIFHPEQIQAYFNLDFLSNVQVKQLEICRPYLLEAKNTQELFKPGDFVEKPIILNQLQTNNLTKLFILCDHALEHLLFYYHVGRNEKNFDKNHDHFGTDMRFLSYLVSPAPKRSVDEVAYDRSMTVIENTFNIKYDQEIDCSDNEEDGVENIKTYINSL